MAQSVSSSTTTALEFIAGDTEDVLIVVEIPDPASTPAAPLPDLPVNLSEAVDETPGRPAVIRAAVKDKPKVQTNAQAIIFADSYEPPAGIEILDQGVLEGRALWRLEVPDTDYPRKAKTYCLDIVVARQDIQRPGAAAGTIANLANSKTVAGTGTAFTKAKRGDIIQPTTGVNVGKPRIIEAIGDDLSLTLEEGWPQGDSGALFEIRRPLATTYQRDFVIKQDVVRG